MNRALKLAEKGRGKVHPNPLVGAVVVKNGRVIGEGFHEAYGGPHAEVNALARLGGRSDGATLYVNLEPCAHFGKTPPCADFLREKKIRRVVIGMKDPNPRVCGKGIAMLKKAGAQVTTGVLENECRKLNADFSRWLRREMPHVTLKIAQTLDGKIATQTGESRWITGPQARAWGHRLRAQSDAILVGVNTILKDNPFLGLVSRAKAKPPLKIILDSQLRTPANSNIFSKRSPGPVLFIVGASVSDARAGRYGRKAEVWQMPRKKNGLDLKSLLKKLARHGVGRILVEGGGETTAGFLRQGLADEIYIFMAPKILGGAASRPSVGGVSPASLSEAVPLRKWEIARAGADLVIHGYF